MEIVRRRMSDRRLAPLLALALTFAVSLATMLAPAGDGPRDSSAQTDIDDWPAMTITYIAEGSMVRVEYESRNEWRSQVVSGVSPGVVTEFVDGTYRTFERQIVNGDAATVERRRETYSDGVVVPARWLHPEFAVGLEYRRYTVTTDATADRATYSMRYTIPCPPDTPGHPPIPDLPEVCNTQVTFEELETFVFRTDIEPPMVVDYISDVEGEATIVAQVVDVEFR